jgi:gas vesicle structural protein
MAVRTAMASSSLVEVVDRILDKGIVIDVWARASLVGIELLVADVRIVIASAETFLKYAEAIGFTVNVSHEPHEPFLCF